MIITQLVETQMKLGGGARGNGNQDRRRRVNIWRLNINVCVINYNSSKRGGRCVAEGHERRVRMRFWIASLTMNGCGWCSTLLLETPIICGSPLLFNLSIFVGPEPWILSGPLCGFPLLHQVDIINLDITQLRQARGQMPTLGAIVYLGSCCSQIYGSSSYNPSIGTFEVMTLWLIEIGGSCGYMSLTKACSHVFIDELKGLIPITYINRSNTWPSTCR